MPKIMHKGIAYGGGGGGNANLVELTKAEYDALEAAGDVKADTLYLITDGIPGTDAGMGNTDISGISDGTVTGAIKAINSKIAYVDHEFSNIGFTAGSIGTRGAQYEWNIQEYINQGYLCVGGFVTFISNSADMQPVVFMTSGTVYLNIYRATASEVSGGKIYTRILLIKN